jgi:hypothetical protein
VKKVRGVQQSEMRTKRFELTAHSRGRLRASTTRERGIARAGKERER